MTFSKATRLFSRWSNSGTSSSSSRDSHVFSSATARKCLACEATKWGYDTANTASKASEWHVLHACASQTHVTPAHQIVTFFKQPRPLLLCFKVGVVSSVLPRLRFCPQPQGLASNFQTLLFLQVATPDTLDTPCSYRV